MSNQEENIIVKKIEGPSVDDEYEFTNIDSYYEEEEEESKRSKIKVILPLMALLVGGGAFYMMQNGNKPEKIENIATSTVERVAKAPETVSMPIKEVVTKKEDKKPPVIVKKSEPDEKEASTRYIEALAMPIVVEKEREKIETVAKPSQIEKVATVAKNKREKVSKKAEEENVAVVIKPKVEEVVPKKVEKENVAVVTQPKEVTHKNPKIKKLLVKKRKPSLIARYEKIKPHIIRVKKGDSLAILAKRFYGNEREYKRIVRANRRIRGKKTSLRLGEKLIIPRKDNKTRRRYIIVEKGNTLAMIAKKFYGDEKAVSKIVRANRKIKSSRSLLHIGQKVYVPR